MLVVVKELDRKTVLVLNDAGEAAAGAGDYIGRLVARWNCHLGLRQCQSKLLQRALGGNVGKIRSQNSAPSVDHMAGAATSLLPEDLFAVGNIAGNESVRGRGPQAANIGDNLPDVVRQQARRRHSRAGNSVFNRGEDFHVGVANIIPLARQRGTAFACRSVDAMAPGAGAVVEFRPLGDNFLAGAQRIRLLVCIRRILANRQCRNGQQTREHPFHAPAMAQKHPELRPAFAHRKSYGLDLAEDLSCGLSL